MESKRWKARKKNKKASTRTAERRLAQADKEIGFPQTHHLPFAKQGERTSVPSSFHFSKFTLPKLTLPKPLTSPKLLYFRALPEPLFSHASPDPCSSLLCQNLYSSSLCQTPALPCFARTFAPPCFARTFAFPYFAKRPCSFLSAITLLVIVLSLPALFFLFHPSLVLRFINSSPLVPSTSIFAKQLPVFFQ